LQILPSYDPGAGGVSAECKRHANIFHEELAKFTLWALRSKSIHSSEYNKFGSVTREVNQRERYVI